MTNNNPTVLSEKRAQLIIYILLILMPIVGMAVDLIAPSLPAMVTDLQSSAQTIKAIISIYLFGYALGNFIAGFLTDAWGRKKLIRIAVLGFAVISLLPVLFPNIEIVLLTRFLQGITLGATAVLARAIFSDILTPEKLVRMGVLIGAMWGLGPVIGPLLGGYLQVYFGWQAGFCFFTIVSFMLFIAVVCIIPETHMNRHPLNFHMIKHNFIETLKHPLFMAMVLLMGMAYSLIITFNTSGPFLIQTVLHYSPVFFGHLALCLGLMFLSATFICRYLLNNFAVERLLFLIIHLSLFVAMVGLVASYMFTHSVVLITCISAVMFFACGFTFPMSMGKGMSLFRHIAGTASATMYLINILITSLTSFLVSFIHVQSVIPMLWVYVVLLLICVWVYWKLVRTGSGSKK